MKDEDFAQMMAIVLGASVMIAFLLYSCDMQGECESRGGVWLLDEAQCAKRIPLP